MPEVLMTYVHPITYTPWCSPLPAPDEQAGDVTLDGWAQRHGHCADYRQHRRQRQIRQLHLSYPLPGSWRNCRDLHVVSAKHGLGNGGSSRSHRRELGGGLRSGPRRGRRDGAGGQGGGDVSHRCGHQPHRPVRTHQEAGRDGKGAAGAAGGHRTLPGDSRHHRPDRLHDRPGFRRRHEAGRRLEPAAGGKDSRRRPRCPNRPCGN